MEKVINITDKSRFRFVMQTHSYEKKIRNGNKRIECGLIILKDMKTGISMIHPFTEFIKHEYGHNLSLIHI